MENLEKYLPAVKKIFRQNKVVFALLFGSVAVGKEGKLSDIDFAVFLSEKSKNIDFFAFRLNLLDQLGKVIKDLPVDVVVLNNSPPLLTQLIIKKGKIIFCQDENRRVKFFSEVLIKSEEARFLRGQFYNYLSQRVFKNKFGEKLYG